MRPRCRYVDSCLLKLSPLCLTLVRVFELKHIQVFQTNVWLWLLSFHGGVTKTSDRDRIYTLYDTRSWFLWSLCIPAGSNADTFWDPCSVEVLGNPTAIWFFSSHCASVISCWCFPLPLCSVHQWFVSFPSCGIVFVQCPLSHLSTVWRHGWQLIISLFKSHSENIKTNTRCVYMFDGHLILSVISFTELLSFLPSPHHSSCRSCLSISKRGQQSGTFHHPEAPKGSSRKH